MKRLVLLLTLVIVSSLNCWAPENGIIPEPETDYLTSGREMRFTIHPEGYIEREIERILSECE